MDAPSQKVTAGLLLATALFSVLIGLAHLLSPIQAPSETPVADLSAITGFGGDDDATKGECRLGSSCTFSYQLQTNCGRTLHSCSACPNPANCPPAGAVCSANNAIYDCFYDTILTCDPVAVPDKSCGTIAQATCAVVVTQESNPACPGGTGWKCVGAACGAGHPTLTLPCPSQNSCQ